MIESPYVRILLAGDSEDSGMSALSPVDPGVARYGICICICRIQGAGANAGAVAHIHTYNMYVRDMLLWAIGPTSPFVPLL
jgi:hypothetical protein